VQQEALSSRSHTVHGGPQLEVPVCSGGGVNKITKWLDEHDYLRFIDNWHKQPCISKLMCKMGRHDFELQSFTDDWVILECFYCGKLRKSHRMLLERK
jgi:hypothetical protein